MILFIYDIYPSFSIQNYYKTTREAINPIDKNIVAHHTGDINSKNINIINNTARSHNGTILQQEIKKLKSKSKDSRIKYQLLLKLPFRK